MGTTTSYAGYSPESGFIVELVTRETELYWHVWTFEFANIMTIAFSWFLLPFYTFFNVVSWFKTTWWQYLPSSNLESWIPNQYAWFWYNYFWIPLPLYGKNQMYRDLIYWVLYPFLMLTAPI